MKTINHDSRQDYFRGFPTPDEPEAEARSEKIATGDGEGRYQARGNRQQSDLFGFCADDMVEQNSLVRAIDVFVENLNLSELGFKYSGRATSAGQPPYDPATLLKLYLYGYQNKVHSGRRLARECRLNVEVIWLTESQTPHYRTIHKFRIDNSEALSEAHAQFLMLCNQMELIGGERISIDGSHFKGNVSAKSFTTKKTLEERLKRAQEQAQEWQRMLEEKQQQEEHMDEQETIDIERFKEMIEQAHQDRDRAAQQLQELSDSGETQRSSTDPDAKLLNKRGTKSQGYNVQIAVDHKNLLIVGDAVTNDSNDLHQLHPVASAVKQRFGLDQLDVVADKGYYGGIAINSCLDEGITPYVAIPAPRQLKEGEQRYKRVEFIYDKTQDAYLCPAGNLLNACGKPTGKPGQPLAQRYRNKAACNGCEQKDKCLTEKGTYRDIWRSEHEEVLQDHAKRMKENPEIYAQRSAAVEHPFGTLKSRAGWTHFLVRGMRKVKGEWSLMALSYNFTRVFNLLGFEEFARMCREMAKTKKANRVIPYFCAITAAIVVRFKARKIKRQIVCGEKCERRELGYEKYGALTCI